MAFTIVNETAAHAGQLEKLLDSAFGPARKDRTVYRFRDGIGPLDSLRFAALGPDGDVWGSIRFWPVGLPDGGTEVLLGPLAVFPELRGQGIGKALVAHGLEASRAAGFGAVLIIGEPAYYRPFGFRPEYVAGLHLPGPVAPLTFMGLEFAEGRLAKLTGAVLPVNHDHDPKLSTGIQTAAPRS